MCQVSNVTSVPAHCKPDYDCDAPPPRTILVVTGQCTNFISVCPITQLFSLSRCHPSSAPTYNAPLTIIWGPFVPPWRPFISVRP